MPIERLSRKCVENRLKEYRWFQAFEVMPGLKTPGLFPIDAAKFLDGQGIPRNLSGINTLDIGCMEGAVAFELEVRGAKSFAMDIHDPNEIGFNLVKEIKCANVDYRRGTVYRLAELYPDIRFDLIVFKGIYYHLKCPIGAFEAIAEVLKADGRMIVAGEVLLSYAVSSMGEVLDQKLCRRIAEMDVPISICYPGKIEGVSSSTWFVPNVACLKSWLKATGWELESYFLNDIPDSKPRPLQRFVGIARKGTRERPVEHPIYRYRK